MGQGVERMTLKCINSGSSGNCYTLTSNSGETLILDCGIPIERLKKCGIIVQAENQLSKVDFINNAIFQFPQDDDERLN